MHAHNGKLCVCVCVCVCMCVCVHTCLFWRFVIMDVRASCFFTLSEVVIVPMAGELSSMKETTPCRIDDTLHMQFHVSGWKSDMLRHIR